MSTETQGRIIDSVRTLGLVGLGVLALHLGYEDVGYLVVGGALGMAAPAAKRRAVAS